jgi:hypothetical protein
MNTTLVILAIVLSQASRPLPEAAAIVAAKKAIVRQIDPALPRTTFEAWLRGVTGPQAVTRWEVNDCGEQTGNPDVDRGLDLPVCAQAQVTLSGNRELYLLLAVGTSGKGVTTGPPRFFSAHLTESGGPPQRIKSLAQVPAAIAGFERLYSAWHVESDAIRFSSNTYDYIGLPSYRKIVALGKAALPALEQKMAEDQGLDFMLAFAVVEICGWDRREFRGGSEQEFRDRVLRKLRAAHR